MSVQSHCFVERESGLQMRKLFRPFGHRASLGYGSVVMAAILSFGIVVEQPHRVYRTPRCGIDGRIPSVAELPKNGEIGEEFPRLELVDGDRAK